MPLSGPSSVRTRGFTLLELAITLLITSLLAGGLLLSLTAQHEATATSETLHRLSEARDALLGFAAAHGRLPCPAAPGTTGTESPLGGGSCSNPWDGFLPAITLGLSPTDSQGYALDGWNQPIRYALTDYSNTAFCPGHLFATADCLKAAWYSTPPAPDLHICSTASGMTRTDGKASCAPGALLAGDALAVIYSRGKNGRAPPGSADEAANGNADRLFVASAAAHAGADGEFDDIVTWLSPNLLYHRLLAAGRLP